MLPRLNGLLLRLPSTSVAAAAGLAGPAFELSPLFPVASGRTGLGVAAAEDRQWYAASLRESTDGANPWDVAHDAVARLTSGAGLAGAPPDVVEPDLVQP